MMAKVRAFFKSITTALLVAATQGTLRAAPSYNFVDLGTLGGSMSVAYGINDHGQIVGASTLADGTQRAFSYLPGNGMTDIGTLGGATSIAYDVNNLGQITGAADTSFSSSDPSVYPRSSEAFLYSNGVMTGLGGLEFTTSGSSDQTYQYNSVGRAINNLGQVTGQGQYDDLMGTSGTRALLFQNGSVQALSLPTGNLTLTFGDGVGINDAGAVVGSSVNQPFLYDGSIMSSLTSLQTASMSYLSVSDINQSGMMVGTVLVNSLPQAFTYHNGQLEILPSPTVLSIAFAYALNDVGQVVGNEFLWDQGEFYRLNDITQGLNGFHISNAENINNLGQIVGFGTTSDGSTHAFMLSPVVVPEPSSLLMLVAAGCLLTGRRRRIQPR